MVVIFSNMLMPQSGILIPGSLGVARYFKLIVGGCAAWLLAHAKQPSGCRQSPIKRTCHFGLQQCLHLWPRHSTVMKQTGYELLLYPSKACPLISNAEVINRSLSE